jgi:spermidine synthase
LVVELDEEVIATCRKGAPEWTTAFADDRVEIVIEDAMNVMESDELFDLILLDATEPYDDSGNAGEMSSGMFNKEFYESIKEKLTPMGIFGAQTGGFRLGRSSLDPHHIELVSDIKETFGHVRVAYEYIPSFQSFWTITFASPLGFTENLHNEDLTEMWQSFDEAVWDLMNSVLEQHGIETAYYDGTTHMRLFTPPLDQAAVYGWTEEKERGCCW